MADELSIDEQDVTAFLKLQKKGKPPLSFYLFMIALPILFFVLLEVSLRIFGYGFNNDQWVDASETKLGINPDIGKRYFHNYSLVPTTIEDTFYREKKENSFRVFVLGGSSAAGYPYMPLGSFSRYIRRRLEIMYPKTTIEVVNIAMTAVNSYTIRDLFPGVLEQKPDLILVYAGHNEYYGALGVGSFISLGRSRDIVNAILYLNQFKTVQLVRDIISWGAGLLNSGSEEGTGTLMSQIAKEQQIPFRSNIYKAGLEQFDGNMRDVLQMAKDENVPIILGTLVSNLRDQPPFISGTQNNLQLAQEVFDMATNEYNSGNYVAADSLFAYAKDLDELRFRAPEEMNTIINKLGEEFNCPVVQTNKPFKEASPNGIIGDNIMTDHLHPTLAGQQLLGKLYYEAMGKYGYLPDTYHLKFPNEQLDMLTNANFYFTPLDSTIAAYRVKLLKNDWPYINREQKVPLNKLFNPQNIIDSLAFSVVLRSDKWEFAERKMAGWYLKRKNYHFYKKQMDALISQYPIILEYFNIAAKEFLEIKRYDIAEQYLIRRYHLKPDAFTTKWLGNISLYNKQLDKSIKYFEESLRLEGTDVQVLYNLAGAYAQKNNYKEALKVVNICLSYRPNYHEAILLKQSLIKLME